MNKPAWILLGIFGWVQKYLFNDWEYLAFLMTLLAVDIISAAIKVFVTRADFTSKMLRESVGKIIGYFLILVVTHVLVSFTIRGEKSGEDFSWIEVWIFRFLILVESISIYENLIAAFPKLDFMKTVVKKLREVLLDRKK